MGSIPVVNSNPIHIVAFIGGIRVRRKVALESSASLRQQLRFMLGLALIIHEAEKNNLRSRKSIGSWLAGQIISSPLLRLTGLQHQLNARSAKKSQDNSQATNLLYTPSIVYWDTLAYLLIG